jgi:hypothetical protein
MTFHAMTEHYEEITVCGKPALFTSIRIKRDKSPISQKDMLIMKSHLCFPSFYERR